MIGRSFILGWAAVLLMAGSAPAQDNPPATDDWDLSHDPASKVTMASVSFSSGQTVAVRCVDGSFDVMIAGLAPHTNAESTSLPMAATIEGRPISGVWRSNEARTTGFSTVPRMAARQLRQGGDIETVLEIGNDTTRRYMFDLPADHNNLDRVMEACGVPFSDARDDLPSSWTADENGTGPLWAERPNISNSYPRQALQRGISGSATVSCIVQSRGRLRDCRVESEQPRGAGFGASLITAAQDARLIMPEDPATAIGSLVLVTANYLAP